VRVDEVHLWLVFQEEAEAPAHLARYREIIPEEERASTDRFHFESGRRQHLITRALVRTVLSHYCDVPVASWRFVRDAHGRPHVAADQRVPGLPAFNLSHTRGLIACAVAGASAIGADVEHVHDRTSSLDIADRYFAAAESAALRALPPEARTDRFFHYWTLKESYIKARGQGLSIPLADFAFDFEGEHGLKGPDGWQFWLCRPSPDHVAAICVAAEPGARVRLTTRRVVPLHSDEPLDCEVLRASAE
jgi:4'-phosphopantetheinyl transferase